jgi:hypothetical protein
MVHMVVSLAFFGLAYVNYFQPSPLCTVQGPIGFLSSMWLMYLLMGVAHTTLWLPSLRRGGDCCDCSSDPSPSISNK